MGGGKAFPPGRTRLRPSPFLSSPRAGSGRICYTQAAAMIRIPEPQSPRPVPPVLRPARMEDLSAVMAIEEASFGADTREGEATYRERLETFGEGFMVLETEEGLAGFITSELWAYRENLEREDFALGHSIASRFDPSGDELYVSSLAAAPEYRGRGYGETLLRALLGSVPASHPAVRSSVLLVGEHWTGARRIYERNGFAVIAEYPRFFGGTLEPERSALVMRKSLP